MRFILIINLWLKAFASSEDCLSLVVDKIRPSYQATILTNGSGKLGTKIISRRLKETPRMLINIKGVLSDYDDPRLTDLNVLVLQDNVEIGKDFDEAVDLMSKFSESQQRQKVLIFIAKGNTSLGQFEYAWSRKFLDLTIINFLDCTMQHYNPFTKEITLKSVINIDELFPPKLDDLQGHHMKLAVGNFASIGKIRNASGHVIDVDTLKFPLVKLALQRMNSSWEFVELTGAQSNLPFLNASKLVHLQLERNEVQLLVRPRSFIKGGFKNLMLDVENECDKLVACVSDKSSLLDSRLVFPQDIFAFSLGLPLFVLLVHKLQKWELFEVVRMFFGMSCRAHFGLKNRYMYMLVVLVSALYNMDFYSSFLDIGLISRRTPLKTFKDLNEFGTKFYIEKVQSGQAFWLAQSDEQVRQIRDKSVVVPDIVPVCLEIVSNSSFGCIMMESIADNIGRTRSLKFAKAKPVFNCLRLSYYFEKSSPFAGRFKGIFRRVYESGIERILNGNENNNYEELEYEDAQEEKFLVVLLVSMLLVSYALSSAVFIVEIQMAKR